MRRFEKERKRRTASVLAKEMAPHLVEGAKIVVHGCGPLRGVKGFLQELKAGTVLYAHDVRSQPGMTINWVRHELVTAEDGSVQLESKKLSGKDKVVGEILTKEYVEEWARENVRANPTKVGEWLAGKFGARLTDDVREILVREMEARKQEKAHGAKVDKPTGVEQNRSESARQNEERR